MKYIVIDRETEREDDCDELRRNMRTAMRRGRRNVVYPDKGDYREGYRMGYRHGWEDAESDDPENEDEPRQAKRRGHYL